jgi:hypothetical protein
VANVYIVHSNGSQSQVSFGVSDDISAFVTSTMVTIGVPAASPSGAYYFPVVSHALFPIAAGSKAFHFLARRDAGGTVSAKNVQFTEVFFPTAYTTVHDPAPPNGVVSPVLLDPAAERREAEAFNQKRIEKELARIAAEIESLKRQFQEKNDN